MAEKADRREFIDLLKRMLTMDQVALPNANDRLISFYDRSASLDEFLIHHSHLTYRYFKVGSSQVHFKHLRRVNKEMLLHKSVFFGNTTFINSDKNYYQLYLSRYLRSLKRYHFTI